ncbi:MAG: hypothetical protein SFW08_10670 [Gemmatimonadaceae bacterium]|nr:hypothetical protein [Gemmatimonadaceae bacterium]
MSVIRTLMMGLVDYAGLFPPAGLAMPEAVKNYAEYLRGADVWALGRFVLPISRLGEFEAAAQGVLPRTASEEPWSLSALGTGDLEADLAAFRSFNVRHGPGAMLGHASIDVLDVKAATIADVKRYAILGLAGIRTYVEIPIHEDPRPLLQAIAELGLRVKVRTGGVTADAMPSPKELARFIVACAETRVTFKATAGLHHPLRGDFKLTYAPDSAKATMHGFLNVFLAAAFVFAGMGEEDAAEFLAEKNARSLKLTGRGITWRNYHLNADQIGASRGGAVGFGSCSFREPLDELQAMGLLS